MALSEAWEGPKGKVKLRKREAAAQAMPLLETGERERLEQGLCVSNHHRGGGPLPCLRAFRAGSWARHGKLYVDLLSRLSKVKPLLFFSFVSQDGPCPWGRVAWIQPGALTLAF